VSLTPNIVLHMLPKAAWEAVPPGGDYLADTLASEGFVHCTAEPPILETIANRFYRSEGGDWLILLVDLDKVTAPVRWEAADGHLFPHIYGPIARAAVVRIVPFPRRADGTYQLPEGLQ
jgi:uncharacterized protein (DUF952 family)